MKDLGTQISNTKVWEKQVNLELWLRFQKEIKGKKEGRKKQKRKLARRNEKFEKFSY